LTTYRLRLISAVTFTLAALPACGGGGSQAGLIPTPPLTAFRVLNSWTCADTVNCQDVYDVELAADTEVTLRVTEVTGPSVVRLALYAPGEPLGGLNILTNSTNDRMCALANASDSITSTTTIAGTYRVAVGRDWGYSSGATGTYVLDVKCDLPLAPLGQTVDDQPTLATGWQCP
jgi:hypothetical protein